MQFLSDKSAVRSMKFNFDRPRLLVSIFRSALISALVFFAPQSSSQEWIEVPDPTADLPLDILLNGGDFSKLPVPEIPKLPGAIETYEIPALNNFLIDPAYLFRGVDVPTVLSEVERQRRMEVLNQLPDQSDLTGELSEPGSTADELYDPPVYTPLIDPIDFFGPGAFKVVDRAIRKGLPKIASKAVPRTIIVSTVNQQGAVGGVIRLISKELSDELSDPKYYNKNILPTIKAWYKAKRSIGLGHKGLDNIRLPSPRFSHIRFDPHVIFGRRLEIRGWKMSEIEKALQSGIVRNTKTPSGHDAVAYFRKHGGYIVVRKDTNVIFAVSDITSVSKIKSWTPQSSGANKIINPYMPKNPQIPSY